MDSDFSLTPPQPWVHHTELYTSRFFIEADVAGPFDRLSDLLNRRDTDYIAAQNAGILPLGQAAEATRTLTSIWVNRADVHFSSILKQEGHTPPEGEQATRRGPYVQKTSLPCYAFTDTYIIRGMCYLLPGTTLQNLLDKPEPFMPITRATIHLITRPATSWQRDVVIVNKSKLEVIYLDEDVKREA